MITIEYKENFSVCDFSRIFSVDDDKFIASGGTFNVLKIYDI